MSFANLAIVQMKQDKADDALISFKNALSLDSDLNAIRYDYAQLLASKNKIPQAIEQYELFIKEYPTQTVAYIALSDIYAKQNDYEKAIDLLNGGLQVKPDDNNIKLQLAKMYQNNAEFNDALKYYNEVLASDKANPVALYNKAVVDSELGKYQEASDIYNELLKIDENTLAQNKIYSIDVQNDIVDNQIKMAQDFYNKGDYRKAKALYEKLLQQRKEDYRIYIGLADSCLALNMHTYAKNYYELAIQIDNSNQDALVHYAQVLYELKDYDTALIVLDKAIENDSKDDKLYYNKALIEYEKGKFDLADSDIKKALLISADDADYNYLQGMILEALNNSQGAIFAYEKYIELSDDEATKSKVQLKVKNLYDSIVNEKTE